MEQEYSNTFQALLPNFLDVFQDMPKFAHEGQPSTQHFPAEIKSSANQQRDEQTCSAGCKAGNARKKRKQLGQVEGLNHELDLFAGSNLRHERSEERCVAEFLKNRQVDQLFEVCGDRVRS